MADWTVRTLAIMQQIDIKQIYKNENASDAGTMLEMELRMKGKQEGTRFCISRPAFGQGHKVEGSYGQHNDHHDPTRDEEVGHAKSSK